MPESRLPSKSWTAEFRTLQAENKRLRAMYEPPEEIKPQLGGQPVATSKPGEALIAENDRLLSCCTELRAENEKLRAELSVLRLADALPDPIELIIERDKEIKRLRDGLVAAEKSLNTIWRKGGKTGKLLEMVGDIRSYANSRAGVIRKLLEKPE